MRHTALLLILACVGTHGAFAQDIAEAAKEKMKNPLFTSSLDFLNGKPAAPVSVDDAEAASQDDMESYEEKIPGTELTFKMIPIPGGKFMMGSPADEAGRHDDEGPQHEVEIKPFWMEEHETTWKEFEQFALKLLRQARPAQDERSDRERAADAISLPTAPYDLGLISHDNAGKPGYAASGMSLYCAQAYCKWLTMLTGRYYRLPTEAEWEYACRAGTTTPFSCDEDALEEYAWYIDNSEGTSQKVKQLKPNPWGLYDMHGNLAEWVLEQYAPDSYARRKPGAFGAPVKSPKGEGYGQIIRGGSCDDAELSDLRSARRRYSVEDWLAQDPQFPQSIWWVTDAPFVGFRVVRPLGTPTAEEVKQYELDPMIWLNYSETNQRE